MLEDLKLGQRYDGFLFLAEAERNPPLLKSHRHVELELNLVTRGSVTYIISEQRYTFPRGSMLWIFPSQEHQLVDRSPDARYYVAVFKPDLIARACIGEPYSSLKSENAPVAGVLAKLVDAELYDLTLRTMDSLMEGSLDPDTLNREAGFGYGSDFHYEHGDPDALNAGLRHLLIQCWKLFQSGKAGADPVSLHPAVRKALTLLDSDAASLPLTQLAKRCAISPAYLSRIFHSQVGLSLSHYRNLVRLRAFMDHYHRPNKPTILESVFAAGFGSYAQFYKVFLSFYGTAPRAYLQSIRRDLTNFHSANHEPLP